ncbi:MAG: hypothetical protein ACLRMN_10130 [Mediterraneibacter gnavus]
MYQSSKRSGKRKIAELSVFYDYQGIESWVTGDWAAKQAGTQKYRDFMNGTSVKLHFIKVKRTYRCRGMNVQTVLPKRLSVKDFIQSACDRIGMKRERKEFKLCR